MPIITQNVDASGADAESIKDDNVHMTIASNVIVETDDSHSAINIGAFAFDNIVNEGTLSGEFGILSNGSNLSVVNGEGGIIVGFIDIELLGGSGHVDNYGTISGYSVGLYLGGVQEVFRNYGSISGGSDSIDTYASSSGDSIYNYGHIDGLIKLGIGASLTNSGIVDGDITYTGAVASQFAGNGGTVNGNIVGGTGNDLFDLSHQVVTGTITGGGGVDTISVGSASGGFAIDLNQGTASGAGEAFDFSGIEHVAGSRYADTIYGDAADNVIAAGAGNDVVSGGAGNDTIDGGAGDDTMSGGTGTNTLSYVSAASSVTVSLASQGQAQATGGAGTDTFANFQNLIGSNYNDSLTGDANANAIHGGGGNDAISGGNGNNTLYGDAGDDTIVGGTGNDVIEGDGGRDTLTGGAGADRFVFKLASDSTVASPDLITDFTSGSDKIDISALHTSGSDTFAISSSGGYTYVTVDQGGDGTIDSLIKLTGANILGASDVIWGTAPAAAAHAAIVADHAAEDHHELVATLHATAMDHSLYG